MFRSRQRLQHLSDDQSRSFEALNDKVKSLIFAVAQGQQNFGVICDLINAQGSSTKQHISNEFEKQQRQLVAEDFRKRILDSLYFPEINVRQEDIKEAHKETFEWIYDKTGADLRPWSIFTQWLEQERATYWICGKAGSGKSTLMNTIYQDERTMNALKVWAGAAELLTPAFFFWNAGTELQRGSMGLLRSLLYQLISAIPVMTAGFLMAMDSIGQHATQQLPVWTEQRLCNWLVRLIENELSGFRLCIFIDGLDEFTGDQDALIRLIMKLTQFSNTKVCLSSRPHIRYDDHFRSSAMLRLQDLTRSDIEHYVSDRLAGPASGYSKASNIVDWLKNTMDEILNRAEGVFLWVALVVNDQLEGIYNEDSPRLLQERLESFPTELEGVYTLMIDRIDRVHRKECALYLQMVIDFHSIQLQILALAVYEGIDSFLELFPNHAAIDHEKLCQSTSRRVKAICKGFLEIRQDDKNGIFDFRQDDGYMLAVPRVVFVHRTAANFLQQNMVGKELLGLQSPLDVNTRELAAKAKLAIFILHHTNREHEYPDTIFRRAAAGILRDLSRCQEATGKTYSALAEVVDQIMSSPNSWDESLPAGQHWSQMRGAGPRYDEVFGSFDSEMLSSYPEDFLGEAARHGLGLYVLQKLDTSAALQNQQYKNYLLGCIIIANVFLGLEVQHLKLMSALLRQGASPNQRIRETTLWVGLLKKIHLAHVSDESVFCWPYRSTMTGDFCDLLLAFLESGADIQNDIPIPTQLWIQPDFTNVKLQLLVSPLTIVRRCFGSKGDFFSVEHAFTARQASEHSVCTTMSISSPREIGADKFFYGLSARQSDRLLDVWMQCPITPAENDAIIEFLRHEIEEIYMELRDEEGNQARQQQQEFQKEYDGSESDSSESESSDEGSFHSANS